MLSLAVSTFIESADLYSAGIAGKTSASYAFEEALDQKFSPRFLPTSGSGGDLPILTEAIDSPFDKGAVRLRQFKSWSANWDGEGGAKPNPFVIDRAISLLSRIASKPLRFGIALDSESRPLFSLRDRAYEGHIVVELDGRISFFFQHGTDVIDAYDVAFDGRTLPSILEQTLNRI